MTSSSERVPLKVMTATLDTPMIPQDHLAGRPTPHFAARLTKHLAADLLIVGMPTEFAFVRHLPTNTVIQRVTRCRPAAIVRHDLHLVPVGGPTDNAPARRDLPAPKTAWMKKPLSPAGEIFPVDARLRLDAAQGMRALKGLPAPLALLTHQGGWLFDAASGATSRVGTPPSLQAQWSNTSTFLLVTMRLNVRTKKVTDIDRHQTMSLPTIQPLSGFALRLYQSFSNGIHSLPPLDDLSTSHRRLEAGVSESNLEDLKSLLPSGVLRIHRRPGFLAVIRVFTNLEMRFHPVLMASFP